MTLAFSNSRRVTLEPNSGRIIIYDRGIVGKIQLLEKLNFRPLIRFLSSRSVFLYSKIKRSPRRNHFNRSVKM